VEKGRLTGATEEAGSLRRDGGRGWWGTGMAGGGEFAGGVGATVVGGTVVVGGTT
jgi:hypothetical protein